MNPNQPESKQSQDCPRFYLPWIVSEITRAARTCLDRHNTRFFQVVTGGNVAFVQDVVDHLVTNAKHAELKWIFGGERWKGSDVNISLESVTRKRPFPSIRTVNKLLFPLVFVIFLCLIPVFYLWHVVLHAGYLAFRRRISKHACLPLIYAIMSDDKDMVKLFLNNGSSIQHQDRNLNNLYHYLADISINDPNKAIRCHRILYSCIDDVTELHKVLTEQENDLGLTGFEAIAKYGSLRFYRTISHEESCICKSLLTVSRDEVCANTKTKHYNLTFSKSDDTKDSFLNDENTCSINLSILEFDVSKYEQGDFLGRQSYPLQLISSRGVDSMVKADVNAVMESKLLGQWMGLKFKHYACFCALGHFLYVGVTALLLFYIAHHDGYPYPYQLLPNFLKFYRSEVTNAINSTGTSGRSINVTVSSYEELDYVLAESSNCMDTKVYVVGDTGDPFNGCQVDASRKIRSQCVSLTLTSVLWKIFIMDETQDKELKNTNAWILYAISMILGSMAVLNAILLVGFICVNYNFNATSPLRALTSIISRRLPGSYTDRQLVTFMCVFFAFYMCNQKQLMAILEAINHIEFGKNRSMDLLRQDSETLDELVKRQEATESVCTTLLIICLLLQFLHAIHALRLLPGIGFFVITTKKMAKHLVQFALVFVIVSLAFATIFHFVMRDKDCPALKMPGFTGLSESLFSTYQVALGQGEHEFTYNFNSKLAYTTYTVITVLLLLNLIIAVMTTTAQELNQLPWKHALCRFEVWDEILGTELTVLIVKSLIAKVTNFFRKRFGKIGPVVETNNRKKFEIMYILR